MRTAKHIKGDKIMRIAIGNDHVALEMKRQIAEYVTSLGHEVINYGTDGCEGFDYPIAGEAVARAVAGKEAELGILICGTGIGISLAANKVRGIRCAVCSEPYSAKLSRQHNDTNIIAFGARVVGIELAKMIVEQWLLAEFEGGRHKMRVDMISDIENKPY